MLKSLRLSHNQSGSTLVVAMMVLVVLSAICIFAASISYKEIQVAGNDNFYRTAFYHSDGAVLGTAKLISLLTDMPEKIEAGVGLEAPGISYLNTESDPAEVFLQQVLEMKGNDEGNDIEFKKTAMGPNEFGLDSTVAIEKLDRANPFGGGAEFGSMSEGSGAQSVVNIYQIRSQGNGPAGTQANITADYWKFIKVPGGL
jgi:hypothetical protein